MLFKLSFPRIRRPTPYGSLWFTVVSVNTFESGALRKSLASLIHSSFLFRKLGKSFNLHTYDTPFAIPPRNSRIRVARFFALCRYGQRRRQHQCQRTSHESSCSSPSSCNCAEASASFRPQLGCSASAKAQEAWDWHWPRRTQAQRLWVFRRQNHRNKGAADRQILRQFCILLQRIRFRRYLCERRAQASTGVSYGWRDGYRVRARFLLLHLPNSHLCFENAGFVMRSTDASRNSNLLLMQP